MQIEPNKYVKELTQAKYKYGFTTDVHTDIIEKGLNEDVVRLISSKKGEPDWLLEFRLKAFRYWQTLEMPTWAHLNIPEIDYQAISYYADPTKKKEGPKSLDEVDPELLKTFDKLGIPLEERMALSGMAVDAVMDSVSVKTTFKEILMEKGIIFCSISEAVREHPDLVKKYLGSAENYNLFLSITMLQLCIVFYKYKDSRLYNDDFATLHTNKCKGKCSLYICKQEKRDIWIKMQKSLFILLESTQVMQLLLDF